MAISEQRWDEIRNDIGRIAADFILEKNKQKNYSTLSGIINELNIELAQCQDKRGEYYIEILEFVHQVYRVRDGLIF